jgi:hypothetical protein
MSDMSIPFLMVDDATVSLIKSFVIPEVFFKVSELKADFLFLGSIDNYSQYYRDLEYRSKSKKYQVPVEIPELGPLRPLTKKHTLHSYCRYYRLTTEKLLKMGIDGKALFFFLPLIISLPKKRITINGQKFNAKVNVYLFPFGSCIIIMDVKVSNIRFLDFVDFTRNLKGSAILNSENDENLGTFEKFSNDIATKIGAFIFEVRA